MEKEKILKSHHKKTILFALALSLLVVTNPTLAQLPSATQSSTAPNIVFYSRFEEDLKQFLERKDNQVFAVDATKKQALITKLKSFASEMGLNLDNLKPDADGRLYKNVKIGADVDKYFSYTQPDDDLGITSEVIAIRKTWGRENGSSNTLTAEAAKAMADKKSTQYGVPMVNSVDTAQATPVRQLRLAGGDDEPTTVLRQTVKYYRMLGSRQVANSSFLVDLNNATNTVAGMMLKSWWPLAAPQTVALKTVDQLKSDILAELPQSAKANVTIHVTSCEPVYYQLKKNAIPAVSCSYVSKLREKSLTPMILYASQARDISLRSNISKLNISEILNDDDSGTVTAADPDRTYTMDDTDLPPDMGDTSNNRFAATYDADADYEDNFYAGAKKFYDQFGKTWSDASLFADNPEDYVNDTENGTLAKVENYDFVFHFSHGLIRELGFFTSSGEIDTLPLNGLDTDDKSNSTSAQLGLGDLDYLTTMSCASASANYCDGLSAIKRYTDSNDRDSIFTGLHIYSGFNGVASGDKSNVKDLSNTYSNYLTDGLTLIEAWFDASNDSDNYVRGASCVYLLSSQADSTCDIYDYNITKCSRWSTYASSFYIESKKDVTIYNRASYSSDPRKHDSDYDIDLIYQYQDEQIPIYTEGHTLP